MNSEEANYLDRFEFNVGHLESPVSESYSNKYNSKKASKSPESHSKKRKQNSIKKTSKSTKRNESPTKNHDYDDKFFAEMEQLYQDLNAIELTKIIKELTEQINEKIKKEEELMQQATDKSYIQHIVNNILRYRNILIKLNNLDDSQKSKILEIYNNPNVHKDDKRNAINAIINGERIITAKPVKTDDKSISRKKRKHGGKKSNKSKKYIKSKK